MMADPDILTRPPMTEKQLQAAVVELAGWLGFRCYHAWLSVRSAPGFPDVCLAREPGKGTPRLIFIEFKGERGRIRAGQADWSAALRYSGAEVFTFRPADWHSGTIERILTGPGPHYGTMLPSGEA
jgi:VRR-NUC domain